MEPSGDSPAEVRPKWNGVYQSVSVDRSPGADLRRRGRAMASSARTERRTRPGGPRMTLAKQRPVR